MKTGTQTKSRPAHDADAPPWERVRRAKEAASAGNWLDALEILQGLPPLSAAARELSRRFRELRPDLNLPEPPEGLHEDPRRTVRAAWRTVTSKRVLSVLAGQLVFLALLEILLLFAFRFIPGRTILHMGFAGLLALLYLRWAIPLGLYNRNLAWSDPRQDPGFSMDRLLELSRSEWIFGSLAMALVSLPLLLSLHVDTGTWAGWLDTLTLAPLTRPLGSVSPWPLLLAPLTAFCALRLLQGPLTGGPDVRWPRDDRGRLWRAQLRASLYSCSAHALVLVLNLLDFGGTAWNLPVFLFAWSFLGHCAGLLGRQAELQAGHAGPEGRDLG